MGRCKTGGDADHKPDQDGDTDNRVAFPVNGHICTAVGTDDQICIFKHADHDPGAEAAAYHRDLSDDGNRRSKDNHPEVHHTILRKRRHSGSADNDRYERSAAYGRRRKGAGSGHASVGAVEADGEHGRQDEAGTAGICHILAADHHPGERIAVRYYGRKPSGHGRLQAHVSADAGGRQAKEALMR